MSGKPGNVREFETCQGNVSEKVTEKCLKTVQVELVVEQFGVGLVIERSLVRLSVRALSSKPGQLSLPPLRGR